MLRNSGLHGMRQARRARREVNPMEGVANLADVMLVFACGLMIAVIMFWQVDISNITAIVNKDELKEVGDLQKAVQDGTLSSDFESRGVAYEDPETGKVYIIMPNE